MGIPRCSITVSPSPLESRPRDGRRRVELGLPARRWHDGAVDGHGGRRQLRLGEDPQPDLLVAQVGVGDTEDVFPLYRQVLVEAGVDLVRVGGKDVEVVELVGPAAEAADPGQLAEVVGLDTVLDPGDLLIRRGFPVESI